MIDSPRPRRIPTRATVVAAERLSPHMVRVGLRLPDGADFAVGEFSDHYVKLLFPPEGADYPADADMDEIQLTRPREEHPVQRAYTVRSYDAATATFVVDFVWHGDKGLAGPWADAARPGDAISFVGPGGAYLPAPDADWHLMIADESALPAVGASLERVPPGVPVHAFVEVEGPDDELPLTSPGELTLTWVHRGGPNPADLAATVTRAALPSGDVHVFLHGDATMVRELRRYARTELGVPRERLSASGYWRRGLTDEAWRASKRDWNAEVQADEAALQH
jgi:NADPH-dependent ferric siderophore reductase